MAFALPRTPAGSAVCVLSHHCRPPTVQHLGWAPTARETDGSACSGPSWSPQTLTLPMQLSGLAIHMQALSAAVPSAGTRLPAPSARWAQGQAKGSVQDTPSAWNGCHFSMVLSQKLFLGWVVDTCDPSDGR